GVRLSCLAFRSWRCLFALMDRWYACFRCYLASHCYSCLLSSRSDWLACQATCRSYIRAAQAKRYYAMAPYGLCLTRDCNHLLCFCYTYPRMGWTAKLGDQGALCVCV